MSASLHRRYCLLMPFLNEAADLPAVLASLERQRFDPARWRLIAIDNGSDDGSGALVEGAFRSGRIAGRLTHAAVRSIPVALNRGLELVDPAEFVVRLDAHTLYEPDYLEAIDRAFETLPLDAWCVGAGPEPLPAAEYQKALQVALYTNRFGLGPADFRRRSQASVRVSTVYLGAFRPGVLQQLGGYDPRWLANEDCELSERLTAAGGRTYRIPLRAGLIVTRGVGTTIKKFAKYGFWRAQTFRRYPSAIRLRHVIPPVVLGVGLLASLTPLGRGLFAAYAAYALGTVLSRQRGERPAVTAGTLLFFPAVHVAYAAGLIVGAIHAPPVIVRPGSPP
ncbi:MAG: glycosyltransferase [Candidatus Eremiobacteraeota bacterium]|nr:glycosyltransferase [Candidatus Eremiobacteraeota bacterium]